MAIDMENLDVVTDPIPSVIDFNDDTTYEEAEAMALDKSITIASESVNYFFALYEETVRSRKSLQLRTEAASGFIAAGKAFLVKVVKKIISLLKSLVRLVFKNAFKEYRGGGGGGGGGVSTPQEINHKIDVFVKNEVNDAVLKDLSKNINSVNIDKVKEAMEKLNKEKNIKTEKFIGSLLKNDNMQKVFEEFTAGIIKTNMGILFNEGFGRFTSKDVIKNFQEAFNIDSKKDIVNNIVSLKDEKKERFYKVLQSYPIKPFSNSNVVDKKTLFNSINKDISEMNKFNAAILNAYTIPTFIPNKKIDITVEWVSKENVESALKNTGLLNTIKETIFNAVQKGHRAKALFNIIGLTPDEVSKLESEVIEKALLDSLDQREKELNHYLTDAKGTDNDKEVVLLNAKIAYDQMIYIVGVMREVIKSTELIILKAYTLFEKTVLYMAGQTNEANKIKV